MEKQLQQLQAQLDQSIKNERQLTRTAERALTAKKQLLATMNQEIRTPVNGMIGMASLLTETSPTDQQREYINGILHCGDQLVAVVNHILVDDLLNTSLAAEENGQPKEEHLDLRGCIKEVLDMHAGSVEEGGPVLSSHIDDQIPEQLAGDGGRLKQILVSLIDNAVKNTPHGEITVEARLLSKREDGRLEFGFEIRDTGNGIPASAVGKIFEGPGLGLILCQRLVEMMDGSIGVQSEPGKGCIFSFYICIGTIGSQPTRKALSTGSSILQEEVTHLAL
jgi:signal transduction histidine kinase